MKPKIAFVEIVPKNTTGKIPKEKKFTNGFPMIFLPRKNINGSKL